MVLKQLTLTCNKNLDPGLIHFTNLNSKWTTDLNVKCITRKVLAGNTVKNLGDLDNHSDL